MPETPGHRRAVHRPHHGPVRGEDGARRTASPARSRTGSRYLSHQRAAAAIDDGPAGAGDVRRCCVPPTYEPAVTERQPAAPRHVAGGAGRAAARLRPEVRHRHRGQLVAPHRRRRRRAPDVRGAGARGRVRAAGLHPLLGGGGGGSRRPAPDGPRASPSPRRSSAPGSTLADMDLIEMHEAFAAQVASNIQALESDTWAREKLGRDDAGGEGGPRRSSTSTAAPSPSAIPSAPPARGSPPRSPTR